MQQYHDNGGEFLDRIVMGDETWISPFTLETKQQSLLCGIVDLRSGRNSNRRFRSDLAPSDFHIFLHLKKFLSSSKRFGYDEELKTSGTRWFHSKAAEFFNRVTQKLIPRFDKCLDSAGGYVEK
ncbi:uncharacterized protein TNCV_981471 [Trichonephila clavipes]|nr:uncharacterized protein TNCV_981471 [Trichonephila clavipes]